MDALRYVTDRGARMLHDYVREVSPFTRIGPRQITVEVTYVVRASKNAFEIQWKEHTYENGAVVKSEQFTGVAEIIFKPPADTLSNPLGLYLHAFHWSGYHIGERK